MPQIETAERGLDDVDARILAHGTAYRLAVRRGVAARLGRDGAEAASRRTAKDLERRIAGGLREAYGKEAAPLKEAARDRRRRPALSQRLRRERHAGLAKDLEHLTKAENRLAELQVRRRRRRRDEADPKRLARRVRPASEEAALGPTRRPP